MFLLTLQALVTPEIALKHKFKTQAKRNLNQSPILLTFYYL